MYMKNNRKDISDFSPPLDSDWPVGQLQEGKNYFMLTVGIELETYCS
jgi:hypothetical protein